MVNQQVQMHLKTDEYATRLAAHRFRLRKGRFLQRLWERFHYSATIEISAMSTRCD
jgi:hypothetical protein